MNRLLPFSRASFMAICLLRPFAEAFEVFTSRVASLTKPRMEFFYYFLITCRKVNDDFLDTDWRLTISEGDIVMHGR